MTILDIRVLLVWSIVSIVVAPCFLVTVDAQETRPWGIERVHAQCVWDKNNDTAVDEGANAGQYTGSNENVTVAIIDTGVNSSHPDLQDNIIGGRRFYQEESSHIVHDDADYGDVDGHGTAVAGIVAAVDNDDGVIGTAPRVQIFIMKLYKQSQYEAAAAINYAVEHNCKIISISFGWPTNITELFFACQNAYNNNVFIVAAAGNDNKTNDIDYPAKYDNYVLAVGATNQNDSRWTNPEIGYGSDMGPELNLMAPGEGINTTALDGGYGNFDMTSAATPHVAGVVALMWAGRVDDDWDGLNLGEWNVCELYSKLVNKTLDLGQPGRDDEFGEGLVNAWRACQVPEGDLDDSFNVDLFDIVIVARAFGSQPNESEWNPLANINIDEYIDIFDIVIVAANFGKVDQP
jgi:subtilisin family serine protease